MPGGKVDEELELVLTMDADGYVRSGRLVSRAAKDMVDDLDRLERKARQHRSVMDQVSSGFTIGAGAAVAAAGALFAFDAAMLSAGATASKKAADFEALTLALAAVDGGAKNAEKSLKQLREIAKGPGLGVEEAISTYSGLRRGGIDQDLAMSLTRELGNAVARSGGGKEVLGRAGLALGQMATKPFLQGEELMQLTEAGIPAYKMAKDIFGTADTEQLKKQGITSTMVLRAFNEELKKTARVAGGSKNAFENLADAWEQFQIGIGSGINTVLTPMLNDLGEEITNLTESGELKTFGESWAEAWKSIFETFTGGTGKASTAVEGLMTMALAASYASRNAAENANAIKGVFDWWADLDILEGPPTDEKKKELQDEGLLSPLEEAQKRMAEGRAMAENERRAKQKGRLKRGADGELYREVQLEDGTWVKESEVNGRSVRQKGGDVAAEPGSPAAELPKQTGLLREIVDNTKPLRNIRELLVGGGAVTEAHFNAVNLGRMTGSSGGRIGQAVNQLVAAIGLEMGSQFGNMARQRHLNPGAI